MARGRMISKSLSTSEKYIALLQDTNGLGEFCQLLYPLLVAHADDFGRLQGDPFTVRLMIYPGSSRNLPDFHGALRKLREVGLVHWYAVENKQYLQVIDFEAHQTGLHKRTKSNFPEYPGSSGNVPEILGKEGMKEGRNEVRTELAQESQLSQGSQLNGKSLGAPFGRPQELLPSEIFATPVGLTAPVPAGAVAPFAAAAAHGGAAGTTEVLTTTNAKATNGRPSLQRATDVEAPRKHKPVFFGSRFSVFDWQLRELEAMVGTDAFDVLGFLFELDSRHSQSGQIIPRDGVWLWLQQQVLGEARRRGMPVVATKADLSPQSVRMMDAIARFVAEDDEVEVS